MTRTLTSLFVIAALGSTQAGCALLGGGGSDPDNTEAQPTSGGGMDPTAFVKAMSPATLGEGAAAGMLITRQAESAGQTMELSMAIVADGGDVWHVETVNEGLAGMQTTMPDLAGMVIGMVVNKEDGSVSEAKLGKPGEPGKPIEIIENTAQASPDGIAEDVTIGLGTFPAIKTAREGQTSWVGDGGDLDGVQLKVEVTGGEGSRELSEMPSAESLDVGGEDVAATKYVYTDGTVIWTTEQATVQALNGGLLKMTSPNYAVVVTGIGDSAEPQLKWE